MGHRVIIIESATPNEPAAAGHEGESYSVSVKYHPSDAATPAQIGNEIARIQRRVNQIIEGTVD